MKKVIWLSLVYMVVPALVFLLVGCMKDPGPNESFGTEVQATDLDNTLSAAQVQSTIVTMPTIQTGEYSYVERTNQVETLFPVTVEIHADTVSTVADDSAKTVYTINRNMFTLDDTTGNMNALPKFCARAPLSLRSIYQPPVTPCAG
jgi:hypothetical protein